MIAVSTGHHSRAIGFPAATGPIAEIGIREGVGLTSCRLLSIVDFFHRVGTDDRSCSRRVSLSRLSREWSEWGHRLLDGGGSRVTNTVGMWYASFSLEASSNG